MDVQHIDGLIGESRPAAEAAEVRRLRGEANAPVPAFLQQPRLGLEDFVFAAPELIPAVDHDDGVRGLHRSVRSSLAATTPRPATRATRSMTPGSSSQL